MMLGSMYVSDPTVWRSFYENMIEGNLIRDNIEDGRQEEVASLECMPKNLT